MSVHDFSDSKEHRVAMATVALMKSVKELDDLSSSDALPLLSAECADIMLAQHQLACVVQKIVSKVGVTA